MFVNHRFMPQPTDMFVTLNMFFFHQRCLKEHHRGLLNHTQVYCIRHALQHKYVCYTIDMFVSSQIHLYIQTKSFTVCFSSVRGVYHTSQELGKTSTSTSTLILHQHNTYINSTPTSTKHLNQLNTIPTSTQHLHQLIAHINRSPKTKSVYGL